jgi:hypothetical protein
MAADLTNRYISNSRVSVVGAHAATSARRLDSSEGFADEFGHRNRLSYERGVRHHSKPKRQA